MPSTLTIDNVPDSWGAWDRELPRQWVNEGVQIQRNETAEEERRLAEAMEDALSEGDVRAPAFFAVSRGNPNKALPLFEEFYGSVDLDSLRAEWLQIVVDAGLGMDVQERANKLMRDVAARFGRNEAGLVDPVTAAGFGGCNV